MGQDRDRGCVLLLSYAYAPENAAAAVRASLFAKYLPRAGYPVAVITASPQPPDAPAYVRAVPDRPGLGQKIVRKLLLPGTTGAQWIAPALAAARATVARRPVAAVFSTYPPTAPHWVALALRRRYQVPWIADFQDPMRGNPARFRGAFRYLDRVAEPLLFRHADALIANTDAVAQMWRRRYPKLALKISHLWNAFDPEEEVGPAPIPARSYRVLAHTGTIGRIRPPDLLLAALDRLTSSGALEAAGIRVRLIGDSEDWIPEAPVRSALLRKGVLEEIPPVTAEQAARATAEADYQLLLDVTCRAPGLQVPSKLLRYLRVGRPILAITTPGSPVDRILAQSGVPYACIYPGLAREEIDRRVAGFFALPAEPAAASPWFRENFNAVRHTEILAGLIETLNGKRAAVAAGVPA